MAVAISAIRFPTPSASVASRPTPLAIAPIVAVTCSIAAALVCPRSASSLMLTVLCVVAARSSSLEAARSSAFAPTPLIDRVVSSSIAAVDSAPVASRSLSFFTLPTDDANSRSPELTLSCSC